MNKKIFVLAAILMVAGFFSLSAQNAENVESETAVEQQAPASTSSMKYVAAAVAVGTSSSCCLYCDGTGAGTVLWCGDPVAVAIADPNSVALYRCRPALRRIIYG